MEVLNRESFEKDVINSSNVSIVDFFADWCSPCKMLSPVLEKLSNEFKSINFAKMNVDDNQDLAQKYNVMGIPCLIVFKNGEEVERFVGFQTEVQLRAKLAQFQ